MSDFERNYAAAARGVGARRAIAIDAGLRAYMIRVYNYMAMGVGLTGIVAWLTFQAAVITDAAGTIVGLTPFGQAVFGGPAVIVLMLGTFGLVMFISTVRFMAKGWVNEFYVAPHFHFPFYGLEWVRPLPAAGMYTVFVLMALASLGLPSWFGLLAPTIEEVAA